MQLYSYETFPICSCKNRLYISLQKKSDHFFFKIVYFLPL
jgi:hypothetical protein